MNININTAALVKTSAFIAVGMVTAWLGGGHILSERDIPACRAAKLGAPDYWFHREKCLAEKRRLNGQPEAAGDEGDMSFEPRSKESCLDEVQAKADKIRADGREPDPEWIAKEQKQCDIVKPRAALDAENADYEAQERQFLLTRRSLPWNPITNQRERCLQEAENQPGNLERRRIKKKICMELPETPAPGYDAVLISLREQCYKDIEADKNGYWKPTKEALAEREARCQKLPGSEPEPSAVDAKKEEQAIPN